MDGVELPLRGREEAAHRHLLGQGVLALELFERVQRHPHAVRVLGRQAQEVLDVGRADLGAGVREQRVAHQQVFRAIAVELAFTERDQRQRQQQACDPISQP